MRELNSGYEMRQRDMQSDSKGRINLGAAYSYQRFIVTEKDDYIILEKAVVIPERELWLHQSPEAKRSVDKGLKEAREGNIVKGSINLDDYED